MRQLAIALAIVTALVGLLVVTSEPAWTDDRALLRTNTAKPYLFILMDNSASMGLKLGANQVPAVGYGDGPASRIYQAKSALYEVFSDDTEGANLVEYGFANFNQDHIRPVSKHWIYYLSSAPTATTGTWNLGWPTPDADGLTTGPNSVGAFEDDVEGDAIVFGAPINQAVPLSAQDTTGNPANDGATCGTPLTIGSLGSISRLRFNNIARGGADGTQVTRTWIRVGGQTKALDVGPPSGQTIVYGDQDQPVEFRLYTPNAGCAVPNGNAADVVATATLRLDDGLNQFFMIDGEQDTRNRTDDGPEDMAALWLHSDVTSNTAYGNAHPFTGRGWEGNYDSYCSSDPADTAAAAAGGALAYMNANAENNDPFDSVAGSCIGDYNAKVDPTNFNNLGRPLDRGDVLPFDWTLPDGQSRQELLRRLSPSFGGNFGAASYFEDTPVNGQLPVGADGAPVIAEGASPLAKAINDFRCWSLGKDSNKCKLTSFPSQGGWKDLACAADPDFGCRRVFLILISDGEDGLRDNGPSGESPTADVSDMKNSLLATKTWALNLGDPNNCRSGSHLHSIVEAGTPGQSRDQCVNVANRTELLNTLRDILGQIQSAARSFASAAVPSVQAEAEQAIYVSNFTPTPPSMDILATPPTPAPRPGEDSYWDGHLNAFLKALPVDPNTGRPNRSIVCSPTRKASCFLWDAGDQLKLQIGTSPNFLSEADDRRRVYYSQEPTVAGTWNQSGQRLLFEEVEAGTAAAIRYDLWRGLRVPFTPDPSVVPAGADPTAITASKQVVDKLFSLKTHTFIDTVTGTPVTVTNILGDIFHSNPLLAGSPNNTQYFAADIGGDGLPGCASNDHGYRCFELKHRNRQKMLIVGANDGMLHAFDAGVPTIQTGTDPVTGAALPKHVVFGTGTGKEAWAYMPRSVLPVVRAQTKGTAQLFSVDGTVNVADVFIDPLHDGTPTPGQREWRTVLVGGLREGGIDLPAAQAGMTYYALDITQPDVFDPAEASTDATLGPIPLPINTYVPSCSAATSALDADCGTLPYPAALWEFHDGAFIAGVPVYDSTADDWKRRPVRLDEDQNGIADLAYTWSVPNIGRIRVGDSSGAPVDRYVAVFGGGMSGPSTGSVNPGAGDWLYIVDIETGQAIYKRRLQGAAASEPAAIDTNQDGYLDRIYIGTVAGVIYRVDLAPTSGLFPTLESVPVTGTDGVTYTAERIEHQFGTSNPTWEPRILFNANVDGVTSFSNFRPIYQRPSVIYVAKLGLYALAFGTGDRSDLWSKDVLDGSASPITLRPGRFFVFVDDSGEIDLTVPANALPWTEARFQRVLDDAVDFVGNPDFFETRSPGQKGWYLDLNPNERVINNAFALSGIIAFSTFEPAILINGQAVESGCTQSNGNQNTEKFCGRAGRSRVFVTFTTNANSVLQDVNGNASRFLQLSTFVTEPYTEQGLNKNPNPNSTDTTLDQLSAAQINVMNKLKTLFPANCKFANHRIDIKAITGDTGTAFIAAVPVCIVQKNWKEF
jgi:hypothetical protein